MQTEFDALLHDKTWTLCPYTTSKRVFKNKWVFKIKQKCNGYVDKYKAKLVAKGFDQEDDSDFHKTFSPVIKPVTIGLVLAIVVHHNWSIHQLDISNVFLHGFLEEELFIEQLN